MKFENIRVYNFENAIKGMRNPLESWAKSDSYFGLDYDGENIEMRTCGQDYEIIYQDEDACEFVSLGPNDLDLAHRLITAGAEHRKFLRQIFVSVDITAPLYWWKEADTYKIGTAANSTSTMHKIASRPITLDCFETGDYNPDFEISENYHFSDFVEIDLLPILEKLRLKYLETKDKKYWKELIRWLPEGWLQTRTWTGSYENIRNMVKQRQNHKLTEWEEDFIDFAAALPYSKELIFT